MEYDKELGDISKEYDDAKKIEAELYRKFNPLKDFFFNHNRDKKLLLAQQEKVEELRIKRSALCDRFMDRLHIAEAIQQEELRKKGIDKIMWTNPDACEKDNNIIVAYTVYFTNGEIKYINGDDELRKLEKSVGYDRELNAI